MSGDATPNLDLVYLDPSQAQPEVKINDAWNKIDAAVGGITVEDADSPFTSVSHVKTIKVSGGSVTAESDDAVLIALDGSGGGGSSGAGGMGRRGRAGARGRMGPPRPSQPPIDIELTAGWNSSNGAVQLGFAVPQDLLIPRACTLREVIILTQGGSGSCSVALWKCAFGAYPPTSGNDITGGTAPAISGAVTYDNVALTGWTRSFAQNDCIRASLLTNSTFTSVKIFLRMY